MKSSPENIAYSLPADIEEFIFKSLENLGYSIRQSEKIADAILRMSDFYIAHRTGSTPWNEKWCQVAQIAYYLPLNYLRAIRVLQMGERLNFLSGFERVVEFGSGLAPTSLAISHGPKSLEYWFYETSEIAKNLSMILQPQAKTLKTFEAKNKSLGVFSYSLTELEDLPKEIFSFDGLMILEPSTRDDGRKLLEVRQHLISKGYSIIAPCLHQGDCPLLKESKNDWCHDRLHFNKPDWFIQIEKHLPIKNDTLTASYLLAKKGTAPTHSDLYRVTGDRLEEKGKTRQMICNSSERLFLTRLNKHGELPEAHRGNLLRIQGPAQKVANELRLGADSSIIFD